MGRRLDCPWPDFEGAYIELPDTWLGQHAQRRDEAVEGARASKLPSTFIDFTAAMSLLDDWQLPGLKARPEEWDLSALDLRLIAWVSFVTLSDFNKCWQVPKNS